MKLKSRAQQKRFNSQKTLHDSGQTLHEVLIASSILAITISGFTNGIISSNQITHQASLRKAAESAIIDDLESIVKHRFYTFRCRQGPCKAATAENDKSLMYYDREDSNDKQDFMEHCNARDLAKELLSEDENGVTTGEKAIPSSLLADRNITITRSISLDDSNDNQAMIEYEAEKDNQVIATLKTTLVPNAVHWCH